MLTQERKEALLARAQEDGFEGNLAPVLDHVLTVGDLMKILEQFNPETPVELEIPVELRSDDALLSEFAYLTVAYDSSVGKPESEVLTLQGCKPEMFETLSTWEEEEGEEIVEGGSDLM